MTTYGSHKRVKGRRHSVEERIMVAGKQALTVSRSQRSAAALLDGPYTSLLRTLVVVWRTQVYANAMSSLNQPRSRSGLAPFTPPPPASASEICEAAFAAVIAAGRLSRALHACGTGMHGHGRHLQLNLGREPRAQNPPPPAVAGKKEGVTAFDRPGGMSRGEGGELSGDTVGVPPLKMHCIQGAEQVQSLCSRTGAARPPPQAPQLQHPPERSRASPSHQLRKASARHCTCRFACCAGVSFRCQRFRFVSLSTLSSACLHDSFHAPSLHRKCYCWYACVAVCTRTAAAAAAGRPLFMHALW